MNVDDSGFDSDTKGGNDKVANKISSAGNENARLPANDDELGVELDHDIGAEDHLLQSLPETELGNRTNFTTDNGSRKKRSWRPSALQQKLERQVEAARKHTANGTIAQQPKKSFFSINRNAHQAKQQAQGNAPLPADQQPLVMIDIDESEDEFAMPRLSRETQREITRQLIKDGYNLDLEPDDDDLDLVTPKPIAERCTCCRVVQCRQQ